jgi:hypothetical protein
MPSYTRGLEAIARALTANPDFYEARGLESGLPPLPGGVPGAPRRGRGGVGRQSHRGRAGRPELDAHGTRNAGPSPRAGCSPPVRVKARKAAWPGLLAVGAIPARPQPGPARPASSGAGDLRGDPHRAPKPRGPSQPRPHLQGVGRLGRPGRPGFTASPKPGHRCVPPGCQPRGELACRQDRPRHCVPEARLASALQRSRRRPRARDGRDRQGARAPPRLRRVGGRMPEPDLRGREEREVRSRDPRQSRTGAGLEPGRGEVVGMEGPEGEGWRERPWAR